MNKRSTRRHHKKRLFKKLSRANNYNQLYLESKTITSDDVTNYIKIHINNPKKCSCFMCGNPRKWLKGKESKTLQERKSKDIHEYFLKQF